MNIKVLGGCCKNCDILVSLIKEVLKELGKTDEVEKIVDFVKIARYGVMKTPALVIDEKVIFSGRMADKKELIKILSK